MNNHHPLLLPLQHPDTSPSPSPTPSPTPIVPDSIPETIGENLGDHSSNDASLSGNEDEMTLQNVYDLCISLCQQIISLQQRFPKKSFSKKQRVHKKYVSKQGRKKAKGESSVQRDPMFEVLAEDKIDHMETENAQTEGRTRDMVDEEKKFDGARLSTEDEVLLRKDTDDQVESTDESKESTKEIFEGSKDQREGNEDKVSTDEQMEGTEDQSKEENASKASQIPTSMTFGYDETIATLLLNMSKAKAASKEKKE
ncbi:hypothetical protein Tco_0082197, partial [Tanacetum coccineum]